MTESSGPYGGSQVSIGEAMRWSFAVFRRNPTALILLAAVVAVIQIEFDRLIWPRFDGLIWPLLLDGSVVVTI